MNTALDFPGKAVRRTPCLPTGTTFGGASEAPAGAQAAKPGAPKAPAGGFREKAPRCISPALGFVRIFRPFTPGRLVLKHNRLPLAPERLVVN